MQKQIMLSGKKFYTCICLVGVAVLLLSALAGAVVAYVKLDNAADNAMTYTRNMCDNYLDIQRGNRAEDMSQVANAAMFISRYVSEDVLMNADSMDTLLHELEVDGMVLYDYALKPVVTGGPHEVPPFQRELNGEILASLHQHINKTYAAIKPVGDRTYCFSVIRTKRLNGYMLCYTDVTDEYTYNDEHVLDNIISSFNLEMGGQIVVMKGETKVLATNSGKTRESIDNAFKTGNWELGHLTKQIMSLRTNGRYYFGKMETYRDYNLFVFFPLMGLLDSMTSVILLAMIVYAVICLCVMNLRMKYVDLNVQEANKANNAKTAFLTKISHDMRTPLNGIIGLIELDERHPDDAQMITQNRQKAKVAASHLLSLINDVLDMTKLEDNDTQLVTEPVNLKTLMGEVMTISRLRAEEQGVTLTDNTPGGMVYPYVYGSPLHIKRILLNLISNGIKYNHSGGQVTVGCELVTLAGDSVTYRFTIEDNGIGMSPEFLEKVFDPFTQERSDARSKYQGTGMGMAIVKALTEKMGGTITVESEQGKGSVFRVAIPFDVCYEPVEENSAAAQDVDLTGMRVLLVEDNELNMEIAQALLEDAGVIITPAENGRIAVELYTQKPEGSFDAILMDIMMPEMDGYEATQAIRLSNRKDADSIPIIAMTANAFVEDVMKARACGMNDHLAKPLDIGLVLKTLAKYKK
ncbi:MAG: ATP-binding protein [Clostridia bacterium]|nr:ATP-binding protein [Clostridia bacterium]